MAMQLCTSIVVCHACFLISEFVPSRQEELVFSYPRLRAHSHDVVDACADTVCSQRGIYARLYSVHLRLGQLSVTARMQFWESHKIKYFIIHYFVWVTTFTKTACYG